MRFKSSSLTTLAVAASVACFLYYQVVLSQAEPKPCPAASLAAAAPGSATPRQDSVPVKSVRFVLHMCRWGGWRAEKVFMFYPLLASLGASLEGAGAQVELTDGTNIERVCSELARPEAANESNWLVAFCPQGSEHNLDLLRNCSARGARIVYYQTEPDPIHLAMADEFVRKVGADEVWDYSLRNLRHIQTTAIKRWVPPHYSWALDFEIDSSSATDKAGHICFVGTWSARTSRKRSEYEKLFKDRLVTKAASMSATLLRDMVQECPIVLNLHADFGANTSKARSDGQMESFRMAILLSNYVCVISERVHADEEAAWQGLVEFIESPADALRTFEDLQQRGLYSCRVRSHAGFIERFNGERVLKESGVLDEIGRLSGRRVALRSDPLHRPSMTGKLHLPWLGAAAWMLAGKDR